MRARRLKNINYRLKAYSSVIETTPFSYKGNWKYWDKNKGLMQGGYLKETAQKVYNEIRLDIGCGKGEGVIASALKHPDILFIGMDIEESCIALSAQRAIENHLDNIVFICGDASWLPDLFDESELSRIYLNFPTPYPKAKHALKRLTHFKMLDMYRNVLINDGLVRFRTDSLPLFEFSLIQFDIAGYKIIRKSNDIFSGKSNSSHTGYERRLIAKGATIMAIDATTGDPPKEMVQKARLSLYDYLPEDLNELTYIPYGMEDTVKNKKNQIENAKRKA